MLKFKIDPKKMIKKVEKSLIREAPKAIVKGLNRAAYDVRDDEVEAMPKYLDRPKPFTLRGVTVKRANRTTKTAYIWVKPIQARYLIYQVQGGYTTAPHVVPGRNYRRDAYGNLPRNATRGANVLQVDSKGIRSYYRRTGSKGDYRAEFIGFIPRSRRYRRQFPYFTVGRTSARANVKRKISRELSKLGSAI